MYQQRVALESLPQPHELSIPSSYTRCFHCKTHAICVNADLIVDIRVPKVLLLNPGVPDPDTHELLQGHREQRAASGLWEGLEGAGQNWRYQPLVLAVPQKEGNRDHESGVTRVQKTCCHKWKLLFFFLITYFPQGNF